MHKILAFLKLIRFKNLIIITLSQYVIKYNLINYFVNDFVLSDFNFFLLVLTTILITAGGYIINDIYDIETDMLNKSLIIINNKIRKKQAIQLYILFNVISLLTGIYLAFTVEIPLLSFIFIYCIYSLYIYSKKFKKSMLIGNIQVALLTGLCIINPALFDILPNNISDNGEMMIFKIIVYYSMLSAIITLIREIIKDAEDIKGDLSINAKTLAIVYGVEYSKKIAFLLTITTIVSILYFQYFQYSIINSEFEYEISIWGASKTAIIYTIFIQSLFGYLALRIFQSEHKKDFYMVSQLCKVVMILGILSIPLFTYLHIN